MLILVASGLVMAGTPLFPPPFNFTFGELVGYIAGIMGFVALIISAVLIRRTGKGTVEVSQAAVVVNERDANTKAVAQVIEALTEGLAELRIELAEAKKETTEVRKEAVEAKKEALELKERVKFLEECHVRDVATTGELISHIATLESMIPTPPGAPPRPIIGS